MTSDQATSYRDLKELIIKKPFVDVAEKETVPLFLEKRFNV